MQSPIFAACVSTNSLHLPSIGVYILWEWVWIDFEMMELLGSPGANDVEENCDDEESIPSDDISSQLSLIISHCHVQVHWCKPLC